MHSTTKLLVYTDMVIAYTIEIVLSLIAYVIVC